MDRAIHWFLHKFNVDLADTLRAFKAAACLTLYHPPSQNSTVYGRLKKTSLTAKLLGGATLILRYYVIRVLRNAVAASKPYRWY